MPPSLIRRGLPACSLKMLTVLQQLREAEEREQPFVQLAGADSRTIRALVERDWIVQATKALGTECTYRITGRGMKALTVYEAPPSRRSDGICPRCGERPTGFYPGGKKRPYCNQCESALGKRLRELGIRYKRVGLCPDCKKRPVMVGSTGHIHSWCKPCMKKRRQKYRQSHHQRLLARIQAGELLPCPKCGRQRLHTANTVYDWCHEHFREYQNDYHHRKAEARRRSKS